MAKKKPSKNPIPQEDIPQQQQTPLEPDFPIQQMVQNVDFPIQQMKGGPSQMAGGVKGSEKMRKAYQAASKLSKTLLEQEAPEDAKFLSELSESDVIVLRGCYDFGETIFELAEIPYTLIDPDTIQDIELRDEQIIFVNCPGSEVTERGIERIKSFVEQGGLLVTTDWSLKHVIERAFPKTIKYNGTATGDDVVRIVYEPIDDTFLKGLLDPNDDPQWWLEGSSYPIEILDESVRVLVSSKEMKEKYGEAPIVVAFEIGKGKVYHMTSHFYLQRSETRNKRHIQKGSAYAAQKGLSMNAFTSEEAEALEETDVASVEAAYTSVRSMQNIIIEQKMRVSDRNKKK
ncbi:MAG: hypothetical protein CL920_14770 [Deltaproteobacteria bacterium]|nr:hypothetical protein [Deltaproteobacteria bacterium]MBU49948.1 hypothetical protein [Deltaproteobacteria bacterium]|tara:strand:+ start:1184 stop:2215 length:1032 start_codon:yes stop_codon:yes gene_type:complete